MAIYSDPYLAERLAWRGGTALYKLYLKPQPRYSEDIDKHSPPGVETGLRCWRLMRVRIVDRLMTAEDLSRLDDVKLDLVNLS